MESDVAYFRRRVVAEKEAALHAGNPKAREAHLELAARYEELISAIQDHSDRLGLERAS